MKVSIKVNGQSTDNDVEPRLLLVQYLRDVVGLTGTNIGCDTSSCGACTVHLNGEAVKSCTVLAVQADGADVLTIEGLAKDGQLHPMQAAFQDNHGLQCGFCTPGMVMAAVSLVKEGRVTRDRPPQPASHSLAASPWTTTAISTSPTPAITESAW